MPIYNVSPAAIKSWGVEPGNEAMFSNELLSMFSNELLPKIERC